MTRRTYRLPFAIDQALERHAKAQGVSASVVVRDALSAYLLMEGAAQRSSLDFEDLKQGQQACLVLLNQVWEQIRNGRKDVAQRAYRRLVGECLHPNSSALSGCPQCSGRFAQSTAALRRAPGSVSSEPRTPA